ncbi:cytochrome P450 [Russula dissimulans]|nr:cytochrome P450 [Russula dissimulans]
MGYLTSILDLFAVLLFLTSIRAIRDHQRRRGLPYPPGPRPLPIIGNLLHIPKEYSWLAYTQFSKTYGDIFSLHVFGQVIVVLNTAKVAKDLLEKRGDIYSDRPVNPFFEMMEWDWVLSTARSGDHWRKGRRILDRGLRPGGAASYRSMIQARAHAFLSRLLANPDQWETHIEFFHGELILATAYGYEAHERDDVMIETSKRVNQFGIEHMLPGALLVNDIPLLRHIPEWLPWFSYKPLARYGHHLGNQAVYPPIQFVKKSMLDGTVLPSLALENFQELDNTGLSGSDRDKAEEAISGALATMYAAGADTSTAVMKTFIVAMLLYPDIQKKVQAELDSFVGRERLPNFEDRPNLPFIDAVCKEVTRWRPITPVAVPHAVTEDDVYAGFFIPKGESCFLNESAAILHDPSLYPEPDVFKPERFLNPDGSSRDDPVLVSAFGFGKRICPGRHFADATFFIGVASVLSVFNIERGKDGGDKLSDYTYTGFLVSGPDPFPCTFVPRDEDARKLILADSIAR